MFSCCSLSSPLSMVAFLEQKDQGETGSLQVFERLNLQFDFADVTHGVLLSRSFRRLLHRSDAASFFRLVVRGVGEPRSGFSPGPEGVDLLPHRLGEGYQGSHCLVETIKEGILGELFDFRAGITQQPVGRTLGDVRPPFAIHDPDDLGTFGFGRKIDKEGGVESPCADEFRWRLRNVVGGGHDQNTRGRLLHPGQEMAEHGGGGSGIGRSGLSEGEVKKTHMQAGQSPAAAG